MSAAKGKSEQAPEVDTLEVSSDVEVVMVRASRGAKPGDKRTVDAKRADELVRAGLAKRTS